jgi:ribonucleotide reductase alpha subunit
MDISNFYVTKRDGKIQEFSINKLIERINNKISDLSTNFINLELIVDRVKNSIYNHIQTTVLDNLITETCAYMNIIHPHYSILAARIAVSNLHKETKENFADMMEDIHNSDKNAIINKDMCEFIKVNKDKIQKIINFEKDNNFDYFGFKTLEKSYLLKINNKIVERPQHMLMRVALEIHFPKNYILKPHESYNDNWEKVMETYNLMSNNWFIHATPT